jgi:PIN domain nuclease of toxin-antitoxin system
LKLLLDTHIWVWTVLQRDRLSRRVAQELLSEDNELWLSPVSTWEALMLVAKGRIQLHEDPAVWIPRATAKMREAPLTHEIALAAQQLAWMHRDPADRFLAATAQVLGLTLVTADERLLGLKDIATLANR